MAGRELKWNQASKRKLSEFTGIDVKPIPTDDAFWRAWKTDPNAMRAAGVKLRKVDGQWQAWMEIRK